MPRFDNELDRAGGGGSAAESRQPYQPAVRCLFQETSGCASSSAGAPYVTVDQVTIYVLAWVMLFWNVFVAHQCQRKGSLGSWGLMDVDRCWMLKFVFFYLKFSSEKVDANCSLPHLFFCFFQVIDNVPIWASKNGNFCAVRRMTRGKPRTLIFTELVVLSFWLGISYLKTWCWPKVPIVSIGKGTDFAWLSALVWPSIKADCRSSMVTQGIQCGTTFAICHAGPCEGTRVQWPTEQENYRKVLNFRL